MTRIMGARGCRCWRDGERKSFVVGWRDTHSQQHLWGWGIAVRLHWLCMNIGSAMAAPMSAHTLRLFRTGQLWQSQPARHAIASSCTSPARPTKTDVHTHGSAEKVETDQGMPCRWPIENDTRCRDFPSSGLADFFRDFFRDNFRDIFRVVSGLVRDAGDRHPNGTALAG